MTLTPFEVAAPSGQRVLDHVALRVVDRDAAAAQLVEVLDVHVIDRTDTFTLIGPTFTAGKLTLLDSPPGVITAPLQLVSLVMSSGDHEQSVAPIVLDCGIVITFQRIDEAGERPSDHEPPHSLVGMVLRSDDPPIAAARLAAEYGLSADSIGGDVAVLSFGGGRAGGLLTLVRERPVEGVSGDVAPMLDHIGVRVDDAAAWREHAERSGLHVDRWVEAPRTNAVFVDAPGGLVIEYVQHLVTDA